MQSEPQRESPSCLQDPFYCLFNNFNYYLISTQNKSNSSEIKIRRIVEGNQLAVQKLEIIENHFIYVQNHVFSLTIKQKQRAEPDVSGRLHRALVETSDRKHCLALMPPSSLCQAGSKTEEETCAGTTWKQRQNVWNNTNAIAGCK